MKKVSEIISENDGYFNEDLQEKLKVHLADQKVTFDSLTEMSSAPFSIFHEAVTHRDSRVLDTLLSFFDVERNDDYQKKLKGLVDKDGENLLHFAMYSKDLDPKIIDSLLQKGCVDANQQNYEYGFTPLMLALDFNNTHKLNYIEKITESIMKHDSTDPNILDKSGKTALDMSLSSGINVVRHIVNNNKTSPDTLMQANRIQKQSLHSEVTQMIDDRLRKVEYKPDNLELSKEKRKSSQDEGPRSKHARFFEKPLGVKIRSGSEEAASQTQYTNVSIFAARLEECNKTRHFASDATTKKIGGVSSSPTLAVKKRANPVSEQGEKVQSRRSNSFDHNR